MNIGDEIEIIETTISYLESAISELQQCSYFGHKIDSLREDISELEERLSELETLQDKEWSNETKALEHEYWQDQF